MRISARQRRLEALAWAGGFFDGEGSTMARAETARPGYRRLNVSVPQSGGAIVPQVLIRFDAALGGLGSISRPARGIYQWRSMDFARSREVVALLRPWIGPVKRRQAATALAVVQAQY